MHRVRLIHWKAEEAEVKAEMLRSLGCQVDCAPFDGQPAMRALRQNPPAAIVIDLSYSPSQGRDAAIALRYAKATRSVPIVFVEGDPEKVARIQQHLPDATYTSWQEIPSVLSEVIAHPPAVTVVPRSALAGYAGVPLPKKLGIREGTIVALVDAPPGFEEALGELPGGARLQRGTTGQEDLTLWFVRARADLEPGVESLVDQAEVGGLWIIWPKKTSGVESDLSQTVVREAGLAAGLVDFKVAAIDATWSGLRFSKQK